MNKHLAARSNWQAKANIAGLARDETAKRILETHLRNNQNYTLIERPKMLSKIYNKKWGIIPDFAIQNNITSKIAFFESKRQGIIGNAHERACKYFAPGIQNILTEIAGFPQPIFTIYMNGLTHDPKKIAEITNWYNTPEWNNRYLLWSERDIETLINYWEQIVKEYLE